MDMDIVSAFSNTPPPEPEQEKTLLSRGQVAEPVPAVTGPPGAAPEPSESELDLAELFSGPDARQAPHGGHYPEAAELYDQLEREDRINGEEVDSESFYASSQGLQQYSAEAGLNGSHVRALMDAARDAMDNPISSLDDLEARNERCLKELRGVWGDRFEENLRYAKSEADRLTAKVPYAHEVLITGAGSNPALVKILADAGRARAKK